MKVKVDLDACLLHGQCVIAAPDVFAFGEGGELLWKEDVDESLRGDVEAASDACPEQAIAIEG